MQLKWIARKSKLIYQEDDLLIDKIAKIRGVRDLKEWINPSAKNVISPYKLKNIDELVSVLVKAVGTGQIITVVPDIDTDGICSATIMYRMLDSLGARLTPLIHAQRSDGHGVETVLDKIPEETEVVLIVDSSANSVNACKQLQESGKTVLIIDHHECDIKNPYAIMTNCQLGDYPNKHLSGSAMCYKVCQVIDDYIGTDYADDFLDLATVGLVADMMSLWSMENRYIINKGLNRINNLGLREILKQSNIDFSNGITSTNISFKVAPILGATSRFDKIELALELLLTDDEEVANKLVKQMIEMNENRKKNQKEDVKKVVDKLGEVKDNLVIVVNEEIDSGFRGLIATEIVEKYSKPVFVAKPFYDEKGNIVKYAGSARSIGDIKLKTMCENSGLFKYATGHEQAFGYEFTAENLDSIKDYFNTNLKADDLQHVAYYDLELDIADIDEMDIKDIEKISRITGQGFGEPKFLIKGVIVEEGYSKKLGDHVRAVLGSNNDTIKINCEDGFALMKFRTSEDYGLDIEKHFEENFMTELEVVGSLNLNVFYNWGKRENVVTKQVFLTDYRIV